MSFLCPSGGGGGVRGRLITEVTNVSFLGGGGELENPASSKKNELHGRTF